MIPEILLAYQPIICFRTGSVVSYEVLSRFPGVSDTGGFVSEIENTGWATHLDKAVILKVLRALNDEPNFSYDIPLSVNITGQSLSSKGFISWFVDVFRQFNQTGFLNIELTETMAITDIENCQRLIYEVNSFGGRVFLDDYGTGYINEDIYMKLNGISGIKLDGHFVNQWNDSEQSRHFAVRSSVLAKIRNNSITAEFIDCPEDIDTAIGLGFMFGQGFLIGLPELSPESPDIIKDRFNSIFLTN